MSELARRTSYSKSYLSKIENDLKPPNATIARLCDNALDAGGELIALAQPSRARPTADETADDQTWVMSLVETGELGFHQLGRRQVLAGAGAMLGSAFTRGTRPVTDERVIAGLRAAFDQYRKLGMQTSPVVVLGPVIAHLHALRMLAADNPEPIRSELSLLASRVAEYVGWMSQEAGDERAALWWTHRAVEYADAGRDRELASYALVREAEIALYKRDAFSTIELAKQAQTGVAGLRVLGLAARCEAQGHALAGDVGAYERALDRATEQLDLLDPAGADGAASPVLGSSSVTDQVSLARGWALCDLGRNAEAATVLDRHLPGIPATARRARARFGARRALAHALNGEIDHACVLIRDVLEDAAQVDSATVRVDLRELVRTLARWRTHGPVQEIYPELFGALKLTRTSA